jgi:hypothetical protein
MTDRERQNIEDKLAQIRKRLADHDRKPPPPWPTPWQIWVGAGAAFFVAAAAVVTLMGH